MSDRKRLLNDLRVIDLRTELEKRNLDKSGVRGVLIQRLSKHLEEQGLDPTTYKFDQTTQEVKTPLKTTRRSGSTAEPETEETPAMEDMIVQDDAADDDTEQSHEGQNENNNSTEQLTKSEDKMDVDENQKPNRKREIKEEDNDATEAKKPCLDDSKNEDLKVIESNTDAEDSINLDIGEDELLNDEADNTSKLSKDEGRRTETTAPADVSKKSADSAATDDTGADSQQQVNNDAAANSKEDQKSDNDKKDEKDKENDGDKKEKKDDTAGGARNLWVSGLSGDTRAKDLKQLCSKHGKVIGAKVVTNARTPGSRCYGYVTMASAQDAENCIKNLHRTELHGRMISVEKARSESESAARRPVRPEQRPTQDTKDKEEGKEVEKEKKDGEESTRSPSRSREKSRGEKERSRRSTRSRERKRSPREVLSFSKIWKERDVARARERSRAEREEERRRRAAEAALRERERRSRQEKHRLELEREKLRAERERIEREKNELLRLERERHRLEREKLELERLELKRAQLRLEDERRKRGYEGGSYRKPSPPPEPYREAHKRAPPSSSRGTFEAPPPPRFEVSGGYERADKRDREREYKREYPRHVSSSMKYPSNGATTEDARQPAPPGTRPKETSARAYESRGEARYRSPGAKPEPRAWPTRYPDPTPTSKSTAGAGSGAGSGAEWPAAETRYPAAYPERYAPYPQQTAYPDRYYRKY